MKNGLGLGLLTINPRNLRFQSWAKWRVDVGGIDTSRRYIAGYS